jgi:hypothetical protein
VVIRIDSTAGGAAVAAVQLASGFTHDRLRAVQGLGQVPSDVLQSVRLIAGKQVGVTESTSLQAALQEGHHRLPIKKVRQSHAPLLQDPTPEVSRIHRFSQSLLDFGLPSFPVPGHKSARSSESVS